MCYQDDKLKLDGEVEVDETFLAAAKYQKYGKYKKYDNSGSYSRWRGSRGQSSAKIPVLGLLQRGGGRLVLKVIPDRSKKSVRNVVLKHVEFGSRLLTDSAACYINMDTYYIHETVNHRAGEYVRGDVYTNGIESAWTHLKRAIIGTHHGVSKQHLQSYCDEFAYRWNNREKPPIDKFNELIKRGCDFGKCTENKVSKGVRKLMKENSLKKQLG